MKIIIQKYLIILFPIIISSCSSMKSDGDKYCNMLNEFSNKVYEELKGGDLSKLMELQKEFINETKEITDKYNQEEFSTYLLENCDFKLEEIIQKAMKDAEKNIKNSMSNIDKKYQENRDNDLQEDKIRKEFNEYLSGIIKNGDLIIPESCDEINKNLFGSDAFNCAENNERVIKERNILRISIVETNREEPRILLNDEFSSLTWLYDEINRFIDNGGDYTCEYCDVIGSPELSDNPKNAIIILRSFLGRGIADANTESRILKDILDAYIMLRERRYNQLFTDGDLSYKEILMKYSFEDIPNKYYQRILRVNSDYPMNFLFKKGEIKPDDLDYSPPPVSIPPPDIPEIEEIEEIEEEIEIDIENTEETLIEEIIFEEAPEEEEVDEIFTIVEDMPTPPDGMAAFFKYISSNLRYPDQARQMAVEGKVFVQFVVDKDGTLTDVQVIKGIGAGCDEEAVRVIEESKKWIPGKQRGRPVKVRMALPITFRLG